MATNSNWMVPRMWEGQSVVILASGPSMNASIAELVRPLRTTTARVIAINTTFRLAPWADMLYAADERWWEHYKDEIVAKFHGLKVSCSKVSVPDVLKLTVSGKSGFDPDPACVRTGGNSGYQAIHIAAQAGAKRILLCGFDMHGTHWHGKHPDPLRNAGDSIYPKWLKNFDTLAPELTQRGIEVLNCTPNSALKCFPSVDLEKAIEVPRAMHVA